MADAFESIPSTGRHRGGRLDIHVTTSVRAQEPVDPGTLRRKPAKSAPAQEAPPSTAASKPADESAKAGNATPRTTTPHGSPATANPPDASAKGDGGRTKRR